MSSKAVIFIASVVLLAGFVEIYVYPGAAQQKGAQTAPKPKERTNPKDSAVMVFIPAGEFIRGTSNQESAAWRRKNPDLDRGWFDEEKSQRRIYLDGYWIGKYEVTVAQYRKFCQQTKRQMPPEPEWGWKDNHPIVNVTWDEATAYCKWASDSANPLRLPTEAEWEKAARGTDGRTYPWGNQWDARKCQCSKKDFDDAKSTAPVGSYPQDVSPFGVQDMAGNVIEWCSDWYGETYYKNAPNRNPKGPEKGQGRVMRGGPWNEYRDIFFRAALRRMSEPDPIAQDAFGFRCAQSG